MEEMICRYHSSAKFLTVIFLFQMSNILI